MLKKTLVGLTKVPNWSNVEITDGTVDVYYHSLMDFTDNQIKHSAKQCLRDCEFFPRPSDLVKRAKKEYSSERDLIERYTCSVCHEKVRAVSDGKCLDCGGFPPIEKSKVTLPELDNDFIIEGRRKCQKCGSVSDCIKEPSGSGPWLCKKCYTGLTNKEIAQRFADLQKMMGDKTYKPEWTKNLVPF